MEHTFSSIFNFRKTLKADKYYRILNIVELILSLLLVVAMIMLRQTPSTKDLVLPVLVIFVIAFMLIMLAFFFVRMAKAGVVDWSQILFIVLWTALMLMMVHDAGGWSAVFSAV